MKTTDIRFDKTRMSVDDLVRCAGALQDVLRAFDALEDQPEQLKHHVWRIRQRFNPNA